ncbi:hypothetical protein C0J52_03717 [Blattella germanica]|nr:hypothetical protein C0J52_03717 [Blattella germanica]
MQKLDGHKFGGIFKFRQPVLLLRDPEIMKTVLVKEFTSFQDNDFHSNKNSYIRIRRRVGSMLCRMAIESYIFWKESRSKLTPAFTPVKLKPVFPIIQEVCSDLMEYLRENHKNGRLTEAKELSTKFTADSVANCAYGLKQNSFQNPDSEFRKYGQFTYEDIAAQALTFFTDGYETSSSALSVLLHNLACHPTEQQRLRDEVDSALREHGKFTFEVVQGMTYLDMVLNESLRMHPIVPYMSRLCTKPFQLPRADGTPMTVEVGTPVITPILAIHNDPQYYPEPKKFDPERFNEENNAQRPKYVHYPFGEGPRICLGMRFAQIQIKTAVATILSEFEIKRCEKTPEALTPVPTTFLFAPVQDIWVKFERRSDKI